MKRLLIVAALFAVGCGGNKDSAPVTDPDAIRKEQEKLGGPLPGGDGPGAKNGGYDPIKAEQDRLRQNK